jgi:ABC-type sugar transport system ATPase subunit
MIGNKMMMSLTPSEKNIMMNGQMYSMYPGMLTMLKKFPPVTQAQIKYQKYQ